MYDFLDVLTGQDYMDKYKSLFGREPKFFPTTKMNPFSDENRMWVRNHKVNIKAPPVKETGIKFFATQVDENQENEDEKLRAEA